VLLMSQVMRWLDAPSRVRSVLEGPVHGLEALRWGDLTVRATAHRATA
jgi:hypothetical protein